MRKSSIYIHGWSLGYIPLTEKAKTKHCTYHATFFLFGRNEMVGRNSHLFILNKKINQKLMGKQISVTGKKNQSRPYKG